MQFETTIEGLPVQVTVPHDGRPYSVRVLDRDYSNEKEDGLRGEFASLEQVEAAIKKYNLGLRKGFSNPTAWTKRGEQVEVTSICADGGGRWCWIRRTDGRREKVAVDGLYADSGQVSEAINEEKRLKLEIEAEWESVDKWAPQWPAKGKDVE